MKKIILLSLIAAGIIFSGQIVLADNATLSVSPAAAGNTVGKVFNASVQLDPANNKVCVVSGTVSFNNLTCKNITVASGLMAQTAPTCEAPSFSIGIPKCATAAQNLFSVSISGVAAGQANLSLTGVKVIGSGTYVAFNSQAGAYNISAAPVTAPKPAPTVVPPPVVQPTQPVQPVQQEVVPTQQTNVGNSAPAALSQKANNYFWPVLIVFILLCLGYGIYLVARKKK